MKTLIASIAMLVAAPLAARAQDLGLGALDEGTNVVSLTTGVEHGLMLGLGYARVLAVADRPIVAGADLTLGWAEVDVGDFRLRARALAPIAGRGRWKLLGGLSSTVRGTGNELARMLNVGADAALLAGRYAPRWFAAAELGLDWAIATHIEHGDAYRMTVYAGARDGWYGNPGAVLRAGLQGGISFGRHDLILRAGRLLDLAGKPALFPFYGTLAFDTRW